MAGTAALPQRPIIPVKKAHRKGKSDQDNAQTGHHDQKGPTHDETSDDWWTEVSRLPSPNLFSAHPINSIADYTPTPGPPYIPLPHPLRDTEEFTSCLGAT